MGKLTKAITHYKLPLGGSLVTLTEFCSTLTGNDLAGMELKNSLKSGWSSLPGTENSLIVFSIANIQDAAK